MQSGGRVRDQMDQQDGQEVSRTAAASRPATGKRHTSGRMAEMTGMSASVRSEADGGRGETVSREIRETAEQQPSCSSKD
jgi:hypothetical protein